MVRYGKEKGVEIIMHHETSAATETYEKQQDTAYALMQSLGIHVVKNRLCRQNFTKRRIPSRAVYGKPIQQCGNQSGKISSRH